MKTTLMQNTQNNNNGHGGDGGGIGEGLPVRPVQAFRSSQFLQELETEIERRRVELDTLLAARDVLLGTPRGAAVSSHSTFTTTPTTVADAVEQILTGVDALHASALIEELAARFSMKTTPKNLINTLNRWVARKRRFKRVQPNTFALDFEIHHSHSGNGSNGSNGNGHARPATKSPRTNGGSNHRQAS